MTREPFWSMPADVTDFWNRTRALIERRDELGGGDAACLQACEELEPGFFVTGEQLVRDVLGR